MCGRRERKSSISYLQRKSSSNTSHPFFPLSLILIAFIPSSNLYDNPSQLPKPHPPNQPIPFQQPSKP